MPERLFSSLIRALLITLAICAVLLLAFCAILSAQQDPAPLIPIAAYATVAIGAATIGFLVVRFVKSKGLVCGGMAGALFASALFTIGILLGNQNLSFSFLLAMGCILISAIFGYLALPKLPSGASARKKALLRAGGGRRLLGK